MWRSELRNFVLLFLIVMYLTWPMQNANELTRQLRARLSHDGLTEAEFTQAVAEILAASTDALSGADALFLSHEIRELEQEWRNSLQSPLN
jgi:hypothetical protein